MELILYHFESCPFCSIVRDSIQRLNVPPIEYRDVLEEPRYRDELAEMNGTRQVPCLVVDGKSMLESEEIINFLEAEFGPRQP